MKTLFCLVKADITLRDFNVSEPLDLTCELRWSQTHHTPACAVVQYLLFTMLSSGHAPVVAFQLYKFSMTAALHDFTWG